MEKTRPILYGVSDYAEMRKANAWFIDRTAKIRDLESTRYAVFLRPRRFGLEHTETKLYVIIDEYDNFTNTILAESGLAAYEDVHKIETILSVRRKEET